MLVLKASLGPSDCVCNELAPLSPGSPSTELCGARYSSLAGDFLGWRGSHPHPLSLSCPLLLSLPCAWAAACAQLTAPPRRAGTSAHAGPKAGRATRCAKGRTDLSSLPRAAGDAGVPPAPPSGAALRLALRVSHEALQALASRCLSLEPPRRTPPSPPSPSCASAPGRAPLWIAPPSQALSPCSVRGCRSRDLLLRI